MIFIVVAIIVVVGAVVGLSGLNPTAASSVTEANVGPSYGSAVGSSGSNSGVSPAPTNQPIGISSEPGTTVLSEVTTAMSMTASSTSSVGPSSQPIGDNTNANGVSANSGPTTTSPPQANSPQLQGSNNTSYIEYFSNVTLTVSSTLTGLNKATAVAYTYGGYLAFSSYSNVSAVAVLRIPAQDYASALAQVEGLGNLTGLTSNSNDVSIQYIDLNATLQSLLTEQGRLLKFENESTLINNTLILEGQLQNVDTQINEIQSQILQTRLLITYSTITVTFNAIIPTLPPTPVVPLKMKLTATPTSGMNPLSVTFNAIVTGGDAPYIINYNFGDGTTYQGQSLIHTFTSAGTFNVTVTATDSNGSAVENYTIIHVKAVPYANGLTSFGSYALGLLVSVVEGIIEVAVVLLPIAAIVFVVLLPFRNRLRASNKTDTKTP
ncbi:MAG TPA: DUF4349 domain-containing protein [Nitrososphaerales archaeon]|nr:DUF4349 domain-containing protein [Nitrososphaerales archaeon]